MIVGVTTGATAWFSVFVQMDVNQVPVRNQGSILGPVLFPCLQLKCIFKQMAPHSTGLQPAYLEMKEVKVNEKWSLKERYKEWANSSSQTITSFTL